MPRTARFFILGMFHLLLGQPYQSLSMYARAIQLSPTDRMVDTAQLWLWLGGLSGAHKMIRGYDWVRKLLVLGRAAKFQDPASLEQIKEMATANASPIMAPVLILAGGTSAAVRMDEYEPLLLEGLRDFRGTVIAGGTTAGISGLAGTLGAAYSGSISTIGYVPASLPSGTEIDLRYRQVRATEGKDFSALEPLQYWIDMISSGISPAQVKLLGINGGEISAFEYRLALMLGASVAVIETSGRAAARLCLDPDWKDAKNLLRLSADKKQLESFISLQV